MGIDQNCDVVNRILVGNKDDEPDKKVVLSEDAHRYARQMGIQLFETSAMNNVNVEESFRAVAELALRTKREQRSQVGTAGSPNNLYSRPGDKAVKLNGRPGENKRHSKKGCCK